MPITPERNRRWYRDRWWRRKREERILRAAGFCEGCNVYVGLKPGKRGQLIHLNHDPSDRRDENLAFYCGACHNTHDAAYRRGISRRKWSRKVRQDWLLPEVAELPEWKQERAA